MKLKMRFLLIGAVVSCALFYGVHAVVQEPKTQVSNQNVINTSSPISTATSNQTLLDLIQTLYPDCTQEILAIYNAVGVTPLFQSQMMQSPEESPLIILNQILQKLLLRPKHLQRYQLDDQKYLALLKERLQEAYLAANLPISQIPELDPDRLSQLIQKPQLWQGDIPNKDKPFDGILLMGSTYQNYLDRQNFFFNLLTENKITLRLDATGKFPVYLLGGERPLDPKIDAPIITALTQQHLPLDEQNMMNLMFDNAVTNSTLALDKPLKRISTNSPNEAYGRPTTAGTLASVIPLLKKDQRILVISSAPFIRYQKWVTERQLLKYGLSLDIAAMGPDLAAEMASHPVLAKQSFIAVCLDNLAREIYERQLIAQMKNL